MGIKILPERDIYLTQEEHERLHREYNNAMSYNAAPVSFEVWVRCRKQQPENEE